MLLDAGADFTTKGKRGNTPLHALAETYANEMLYIMRWKEDIFNFISPLKKLIGKIKNIDEENEDGITPLGILLKKCCHLDCYKDLNHMNMHSCYCDGNENVESGLKEIIQLFIDHKANPNFILQKKILYAFTTPEKNISLGLLDHSIHTILENRSNCKFSIFTLKTFLETSASKHLHQITLTQVLAYIVDRNNHIELGMICCRARHRGVSFHLFFL